MELEPSGSSPALARLAAMSERTTTGSGTITRMIDPKDITFLEIFPEWAVTYPVWWDGGSIGGESLAALGDTSRW